MAWTSTEGSHMFAEFAKALIANSPQVTGPTSWGGLDGDTIKVALFNNTGTPNENATLAHSAYNASGSQWVTANEVTDSDGSSDWSAGGITLSSKTIVGPNDGGGTSDIVQFDAADATHSNTVTLTSAYGCLVYDDSVIATGSVADLGVSFHYFGGAQSVTAGTFSVIWHANGIFRISV